MKPALAAGRAMSVINFMMVQPRMAFTLSELSKALGVSPASMTSILLALQEAGYITRHPRHRTYSLGPALVAAGHAAAQRHPEIEAARPEMARLSNHGGECLGSVAVGDDILIVSIEGRPNGLSRQSWIGQRIPLLPPFGEVFMAWAPDEQVDRWIRRLGDEPYPTVEKALRESLSEVRARGMTIGLMTDPADQVIALTFETATHHRGTDDRLSKAIPKQLGGYLLHSIDKTQVYDIANLAVPVFGPDGQVVMAMTLTGIAGIKGEKLMDLCGEMVGAGRAVTREIGGRVPNSALQRAEAPKT